MAFIPPLFLVLRRRRRRKPVRNPEFQDGRLYILLLLLLLAAVCRHLRPLSSAAAKLETLDHRVWTGEGSLVVRRRVVELEVAAALVVVRLLPSSVSI